MNTYSWSLTGDLTLETALAILAEGQQKIANAPHSLTIDLQKIDTIDSAGIAVLLEWLRFAKTQQKLLNLQNPPPKLLAITTLCNLQNILSFT